MILSRFKIEILAERPLTHRLDTGCCVVVDPMWNRHAPPPSSSAPGPTPADATSGPVETPLTPPPPPRIVP